MKDQKFEEKKFDHKEVDKTAGKKGGRKKGFKKREDKESLDKKKGCNDVSWYMRDKLLILQSFAVSTYHTSGTKFPKWSNASTIQTDVNETVHDVAGAGVLAYELCPGAAGAKAQADPINRGFINLFNQVRGMYTSTVPFQPNDLAMYTLALGNVVFLAGYIQKLLGWVNLYSSGSINIPYQLFRSAGTDYNVEKDVYATNIYAFNLAIKRLSVLTKPTNMTYFDKMYWGCRHTYLADDGLDRGTIFHFVPHGVWQWNSQTPTEDNESILASGLEYFPATQWQGNSISQLIVILNTLISSLINDDNIRTISGWLHQYVPASKIEIVSDFLLRTEEHPVYNFNILNMIKNGKFCQPYGIDAVIRQNVADQCIVDNNRKLTAGGQFTGIMGIPASWILTFPHEPSMDDLIEATRLLNLYEKDPSSSQYLIPVTDVLTFGNATYYTRDDTILLPQSVKYGTTQSDAIAAEQNLYNYLRLMKRCEAVPSLIVARVDGGGYVADYEQLQDIDYSFTIKYADLVKMHEACLVSLFTVDELNKK